MFVSKIKLLTPVLSVCGDLIAKSSVPSKEGLVLHCQSHFLRKWQIKQLRNLVFQFQYYILPLVLPY